MKYTLISTCNKIYHKINLCFQKYKINFIKRNLKYKCKENSLCTDSIFVTYQSKNFKIMII